MNRLALLLVCALAACSSSVDANFDQSIPDAAPDLAAADGAVNPDLQPACATSAGCADPSPICGGGSCRACAGATDDTECAIHKAATPRCDLGSHQCVTCRAATQDSDCAAATPVCDLGGACRKCAAHTECSSQVCKDDGSCALAGDIVFVDNKGGLCAGVHGGTAADPYCDLATAIANLGAKTYIRVLGSATAYAPITVSSGTIKIIGGAGVKLAGTTNLAAVTVKTSANLTLDGFEITGGPGDGLDCSSAGTVALTLVHSWVHDSAGLGISASHCPLTLDGDRLGPTNNGAVAVSNTSYAITNCLIAGNGSVSSAVAIAANANGAFRHNTVVANNATTVVGGIDCGNGAAKAIESSIIWMNSKLAATSSQVTASCTLTNCDVDETIAGNQNVAPDFVSATDHHLNGRTANNLACCVDRIVASPVDHDYDGRARPVNVKFDVGAHEVP